MTSTLHLEKSDTQPSLTITGTTLQEGDSGIHTATVTVSLSEPTTTTTTVHYQTQDFRTCLMGRDYQPTNGIVTFAPGETAKNFTVYVIGDKIVERDESFKVVLSDAQGASIANPLGTVTIQSDDLPLATIHDVLGIEGQTVSVPVTLDRLSTFPVAVKFTLLPDSAVALTSKIDAYGVFSYSGDYHIPISYVVTFQPNQSTKLVPIALFDDTTSERIESFKIRLTEATNARLATDTEASITIQDNETTDIFPHITTQNITALEGQTAIVPITLDEETQQTVTLRYHTEDGSARTNFIGSDGLLHSDYTSQSNLITFKPGETLKTVSIPLVEDTEIDPNETFNFILETPTNGILGSNYAARVNILDNDLPQPVQPPQLHQLLSMNIDSSNGQSDESDLSGTGQYAVFSSQASNLIAIDNNRRSDIFLADRNTDTLTRLSQTSTGLEGNGNSVSPAISDNGRYVVFASDANNFINLDINRDRDIFVADNQTHTLTCVSQTLAGILGNSDSDDPDISGDGHYAVFTSKASNLVLGDTNGVSDIFRKDLLTGEIVRVSVGSGGLQGHGASSESCISSDGRYVAFRSASDNWVANDLNVKDDVFLKDMVSGDLIRISQMLDGSDGDGWSGQPTLSANGETIAFLSAASNLIPMDANSGSDIFVWKKGSDHLILATTTVDGQQSDDTESSRAALSGDGRYIVVPVNDGEQLYLKDIIDNWAVRLTMNANEDKADGISEHPSISADGHSIAWTTEAENLTWDIPNYYKDIVFIGNNLL